MTKLIEDKKAKLVVIANNVEPLEMIVWLPQLCKKMNIPYCFVESKAALGRACGIKRPVVAAGIIFKEGSHLHGQILELKDRLEQLLV